MDFAEHVKLLAHPGCDTSLVGETGVLVSQGDAFWGVKLARGGFTYWPEEFLTEDERLLTAGTMVTAYDRGKDGGCYEWLGGRSVRGKILDFNGRQAAVVDNMGVVHQFTYSQLFYDPREEYPLFVPKLPLQNAPFRSEVFCCVRCGNEMKCKKPHNLMSLVGLVSRGRCPDCKTAYPLVMCEYPSDYPCFYNETVVPVACLEI